MNNRFDSIKNKTVSLAVIIAMFFAMTITAFCVPNDAYGAMASGTKASVTPTNGVNVRSGAGTGYDIVTALEYMAQVTIKGTDKDTSGALWYKVETPGGNVGYIRSDLLSEVKTPVRSEVPEVPEYIPVEYTHPQDLVEYTSKGDFEEYLTNQGFPESYKPYLRELHSTYPEWRFIAQKTGLQFFG